jgi:hypothetical protein
MNGRATAGLEQIPNSAQRRMGPPFVSLENSFCGVWFRTENALSAEQKIEGASALRPLRPLSIEPESF